MAWPAAGRVEVTAVSKDGWRRLFEYVPLERDFGGLPRGWRVFGGRGAIPAGPGSPTCCAGAISGADSQDGLTTGMPYRVLDAWVEALDLGHGAVERVELIRHPRPATLLLLDLEA